jgi:arylsulfatase A-like enzyme
MRVMRVHIGRIAGCAAALGILMAAASGGEQATAQPRPNIIVVQTDDQNPVELNYRTMPATERLLAGAGTTFDDYLVATPMCCPSRASLLTGEYPHNDGITANDPGYPTLIDPQNTLPAWLQAAGYRTAHVGKYLNNYADSAGSIAVPAPGWDRWISAGDDTRYFNYELGIDGAITLRGDAPRDYVTRVLDHQALTLIQQWAPGKQPYYLELDERAPHESTGRERNGNCPVGPIPDPQDTFAFSQLPLPQTANFDEQDVSDKPRFIRRLKQFDEHGLELLTKTYRCRLASLREVDRGVAAIYRALRETGSLRRTVIVFVSDNGFFQGEHRIPTGKTIPYYEAVHVPLVIRLPPAFGGQAQPRRVPDLAANIDIAPTLLDLAGATPCAAPGDCLTMDGQSLLPLLAGEHPDWATGRTILVEYREDPSHVGSRRGVCAYRGVYRKDANYVEYSSAATLTNPNCGPTNEREHYDLASDPFQLQNLVPADPGTPAALQESGLKAELDQLRDCSGIEGRDPLPQSGHYCG